MKRVHDAVAGMEQAIKQFNPRWVFALFSGGGDSRTASYVASLHPRFNGCVFINTGTGIEATRQHVIDTCAEQAWPLKEYKAKENTKADGTPDPMDYEQIVLTHGFPGPIQHRAMYSKLKERAIRMLMREHDGNVLLVSGAREQESERRMGHGSVVHKEGRQIWLNIIWNWSKSECSEVLASARIKPNEAALKFGRSGECLCGAFARRGELAALELADPVRAAEIRDLELRVRANGFPWGWEDPGPPQWWIEKNQGQTFMLDYDADYIMSAYPSTTEHLCTSCKWRAK